MSLFSIMSEKKIKSIRNVTVSTVTHINKLTVNVNKHPSLS